MLVLGLDIGSSSVKAGLLRNGKLIGGVARVPFDTDYHHDRAEVRADDILRAIGRAISDVGAGARRVEVVALSAMAASWVAMDKRGRAITPVITHQDRRSTDVAKSLIASLGRPRFLKLTGNLPFPGGISSTTWAWFNRNARSLMRRADLVGHVQTLVHRTVTASRVVDPSHASFMGLYDVVKMRGWSEEVCALVGATEHQLPQIVDACAVAGMVTRAAGAGFGLTHGTPMLCGCIDTSAAMLLAGARRGQMLNVSGSTDVLALCTDDPKPHEQLLTRCLGTGRAWMSVSTLAAGGTSLAWANDQLFPDLSRDAFFKLVNQLSREKYLDTGGVTFDPYLAGSRTDIEQRRASFGGLTLSATRKQMLAAIIDALARASAARVELLRKTNSTVRIDRHVIVSGGVQGGLHNVLHRDWPGKWTYRAKAEATLRGLAVLAEGAG